MFGVQVINILVNGKATGILLFILMLIVSCCISCTTKATTTESLEHPYVVPITSDAQVSKSNSLVVKISGELSGPGAVAVHYWSFDGPKFESSPIAISGTKYELSILRLRADTSYKYQVLAISDSGYRVASDVKSFVTGSLPKGLDTAKFDVLYGHSSYPLTFLEFRQNTFYGLVAIDSDGYVVWYYEGLQGHEPYVMDQRENGNIVYLDGSFGVVAHGLVEITPLGEEIARLDDICSPGGPVNHQVKLCDQW